MALRPAGVFMSNVTLVRRPSLRCSLIFQLRLGLAFLLIPARLMRGFAFPMAPLPVEKTKHLMYVGWL